MAKLKHIHTYRRVGFMDILLGWHTRDGDTDGLSAWNGTGWTLLWELPGTDLIYDSVTWKDRVFFVDGKHVMLVYDANEASICEIEKAPPVQYLVVYQDRLVGAGDARSQAEVEADGQVWPVDSNRDRVLWCEVLDEEEWSANSFLSAQSGTGEVISGLGVNSITSADRGAQSQLVVFKPNFTMINDGVLNAADQRLNFASAVLGCPGYHSITNTPYGLMFCSRETVCLMSFDAREPQQIGFLIHPMLTAVPDALAKWTAGFFHDNSYKLSIGAADAARNNSEWWLDIRPAVFPQQSNWYGPHTGDFILQYELYDGMFVGAEMDTMQMWELDVEGQWGSMVAPATARTSTLITSRLMIPDMKEAKLDAYGFSGACAAGVTLDESVSVDRGTQVFANTFTTPASLSAELPHYNVTRPIRRPGHEAQVTLSHDAASDMIIDTIYIRGRSRRRQSEKHRGSTQGST